MQSSDFDVVTGPSLPRKPVPMPVPQPAPQRPR